MLPELINNRRRHCQRPSAPLSLQVDQLKLSVDSLELLPPVDVAGSQVDVLPSQPKCLALAQADSQGNRVKGAQPVVCQCVEQLSCLGAVQRLDFIAFTARAIDEACGTSTQIAPPDSLLKGCTKGSTYVSNRLRRQALFQLALEEGLHVGRAQSLQSEMPERRLEVQPYVDLLAAIGPGPD